ncbi:MAG TPA: hypothetical protein VHX63_09950 [Acidobacteriaceae bacterium]|nr:hypothetical protein [Acidobacteriaceae bacterium]
MSAQLHRGCPAPGSPLQPFRLSTTMRFCLALGLVSLLLVSLLLAPCMLRAQETDPAVLANQKKARQVLDATIQALGGPAWLNIQSVKTHGRSSGFYQGHPSGSIIEFFDTFVPPDKERIEYTKKKNVVQIFTGRTAWEITYKGKHALPQEQYDEYLRRHDHSLRVVLQQWYKDPDTILIYGKQTLVERKLADQVTLINKDNDSVTLEMDAESHLPLRDSWDWRDPRFHDKNHDAEEYDDYHLIDGFPTPFTITRYQNGDMTNERFIYSVEYNVPLRDDMFDADLTAQHIH